METGFAVPNEATSLAHTVFASDKYAVADTFFKKGNKAYMFLTSSGLF